MKKVTNDILYVGVNDHQIDLFEGQYSVPDGMSYNSYLVLDEKISVFDTTDSKFVDEWLFNINEALAGKKPDYLIVQHMEPDHSSGIIKFMETYPDAVVVSNTKTFKMMSQFFKTDYSLRNMTVKDGEELCSGKHVFKFVFAPMVHWPEVMVTYDMTEKVLFSADGFGKFGALDTEQEWKDEARRYYIGIVGKYGVQVQNLLKKASSLDIEIICPLHGPVLDHNLSYYLSLYDIWSSYKAEEQGTLIAYTSVYGNTKKAALELASELEKSGEGNVCAYDLARCDMSFAVSEAFKYSNIVLATTTYNADIFPYMKEFISHLTERNFQNRKVGIIENGSWAPLAAKIIKSMLEGSKNIVFAEPVVTLNSALNDESRKTLMQLSEQMSK